MRNAYLEKDRPMWCQIHGGSVKNLSASKLYCVLSVIDLSCIQHAWFKTTEVKSMAVNSSCVFELDSSKARFLLPCANGYQNIVVSIIQKQSKSVFGTSKDIYRGSTIVSLGNAIRPCLNSWGMSLVNISSKMEVDLMSVDECKKRHMQLNGYI